MLASIWYGLARCQTIPPRNVWDLYYHAGGPPEIDEVKIQQFLDAEIANFSRVFIIVDAYTPGIGAERDIFLRLHKSHGKVNFLFTSSSPETVASNFQDLDQWEVQADEEDIRNFIQNKIDSRGRLFKFNLEFPGLSQEIIDGIVLHANGK
jgi:hypothetical protein